MEKSQKILWLASYPKSGNTWFRVFLTNLLRDDDEPASINELERTPIASARNIFDEISGIASSELSADEIDMLRPDVYCKIAEESEDILFQKAHDAYTYLPDSRPLIPAEATKAAIYIIRNPLDVAVSFAHHSSLEYDKMIRQMNNPEYSFCGRTNQLHNQLRQKLLTWSDHVKSWTDQKNIPVHIIKYEDMKENTFDVFKKAVNFIGISTNDNKINKAIQFSSFSVLKQQEMDNGFNEKAANADSFFRKGITGSWKEELTDKQVKQIINDHKVIMEKYGYL